MLRMKYLLTSFVFLLVAAVLFGCGKGMSKKDFETKVNAFELPSDVITDTNKFYGSFKLTKKIAEGKIDVEWTSSDSKLIEIGATTAKVFNPEYLEGEEVPAPKNVKLTAKFKCKNLVKEKTFEGELQSYKVKEMELKELHNISKEKVDEILENTKDIKVRVKNVIVAAINTGRFDIVDKDGINRTLVFLGGTNQDLVPDDIKVGNEIDLSASLAQYYGVLQLTSKTIPNEKVLSSNKNSVIKVDENETIAKQVSFSTSLNGDAIDYLKRDANYSKVVKMMAKVVVTNKDDKKYGVELEDLATGQRVLASYGYIYEELKALDGKIIEFKAITAVDVRNSEDATKDNAESKVTGKFDPRIGVIEILNKDVKETDELKAKWTLEKEFHEAFKTKALNSDKFNLIPSEITSEEEGAFKGKFNLVTEKDDFKFEYTYYDENDPLNKNVNLNSKKIDYLKEGTHTVLLKVKVIKGDNSMEFISGIEIDSKAVENIENFDELYAENPDDNTKYKYEGKIVSFKGIIYDKPFGKNAYVVKSKDDQSRVFQLRGTENIPNTFEVGHEFKFVGTLKQYAGSPQLEISKFEKCEHLGAVEGFVTESEVIDNTKNQEYYDGLATKKNKNIIAEVTITEVGEAEAGKGQTVKGKVGDVIVTIRLGKSVIGKLEKDKTYELKGQIDVYKSVVQIKISNKKQITAK